MEVEVRFEQSLTEEEYEVLVSLQEGRINVSEHRVAVIINQLQVRFPTLIIIKEPHTLCSGAYKNSYYSAALTPYGHAFLNKVEVQLRD